MQEVRDINVESAAVSGFRWFANQVWRRCSAMARTESNGLSYAPPGLFVIFCRLTHGSASLHRGLLSLPPPGPDAGSILMLHTPMQSM